MQLVHLGQIIRVRLMFVTAMKDASRRREMGNIFSFLQKKSGSVSFASFFGLSGWENEEAFSKHGSSSSTILFSVIAATA